MKLKIKKSVTLDDLLNGCRRNKAHAQEGLFQKYSERMLGICRRYVGDISEAEDIMIKGFMKIFEKIGQYKEEGSFEGWMTRIMVNESLTYIRRSKNMWIESSLDNAITHPNYSWVENNIDADQIMSFIDDLPLGYKTIFNMYAIEGYSHKEISMLLNISMGASKSQLSRAKSHLRMKISEYENNLKIKRNENR